MAVDKIRFRTVAIRVRRGIVNIRRTNDIRFDVNVLRSVPSSIYRIVRRPSVDFNRGR